MMRHSITSLLLLLSSLLCSPLLAAENLLFQGTLNAPPPCKINGGDLVDIDFGERVGINKVNGVNYRRTIDYHITCEPTATALDITLILSGPQSSYGDGVIQSSQEGLGIKILQNGRPFILDKPLFVDPKNPPKLEAVPVKESNARLKADVFVATAVLLAQYQ
ncbi:fimbrial protein [Yersinia kristensenii]|uniref:fimbrial protein n=1 Tax=Yersinia kristensenii TaxID=28152 RepID=UPI0005DDB9E9|nr:fimbrial protein [Yersinia kristensenii]CNE49324.1 minor pili exported protein [Yersinia kristensenii]CNG89592.1 minor pili exported protein [Yersinia kristensenii]CNK25109.1 minor pili exported protein [Yersinia kristensenii]